MLNPYLGRRPSRTAPPASGTLAVCRQLAYLGPPVTLQSLVLEPEHSLLKQSYEPKHQRHGVVNADGFGCGWFDQSVRSEPAVYRKAQPIWADPTFKSIAGMISSAAVLAAVRDASIGTAVEESSTAPFTARGLLFAHNGMFKKFDGPPGAQLRRMVSDARFGAIRGTSDSEFLFALILDGLEDEMEVGDAMSTVIARCLELSSGTFNFLVHDGRRITATRCGESLYLLEGSQRRPGALVVASEPFDDDPAWREVPDGSVVRAAEGEATVWPMGGRI
ncbi:MAG: ergothioneine biosynthesis protein EgtC [Actinomycetota bacterium]